MFMEPHFGHDFSRVQVQAAAPTTIQTKLTINQPNDRYEQEADRVADEVMRMPQPQTQQMSITPGAQSKATLLPLEVSGPQTQLALEQSNPEHEEAEPIADRVKGISKPTIQRQPEPRSLLELDEEELKRLTWWSEEAMDEELLSLGEEEWLERVEEEELDRLNEEERRRHLIQPKRADAGQPPIPTGPQILTGFSMNGGGRPLPSKLRRFFERRFGFDFSRVRIFTDRQAAESTRAMNALAYTAGRHVVFGAGQFAPETEPGRRLLAHELTHVVQQSSGTIRRSLQRKESQTKEQRRPRPAPVDAAAQRIIDLAHDRNRPIQERAVDVVRAIIDQYFTSDASKISRIQYRESQIGLHQTYSGRGASTTGIITVGRYFVEQTTQPHFARRVAQVRHEIEHVEQQRAGMTGQGRRDEREFLAFYHEALFQELPGTGRFQHSTRVQLIDAALGYYYCLSASLQNSARRDELIARRAREVSSGRTNLGVAPTTCGRQAH